MPDTENTNLESRIKKWLSTQGYPLEMEVAKAFRESGFTVVQSEYYRDDESDSNREIDVVATAQEKISNSLVRIRFIVECKFSTDKPWLIFTSDSIRFAPKARIVQRAASITGRNLLESFSDSPLIQELELFKLPPRPGYSLTQAFTSGEDKAYGACLSLAKATKAFASKVNEYRNADYIDICFPLIVIDASLFESFLSETNEVEVSRIETGILVWRNQMVGRPHSMIYVVTKDGLQKFLSDSRKDISLLLQLFRENVSLVQRSWNGQ